LIITDAISKGKPCYFCDLPVTDEHDTVFSHFERESKYRTSSGGTRCIGRLPSVDRVKEEESKGAPAHAHCHKFATKVESMKEGAVAPNTLRSRKVAACGYAVILKWKHEQRQCAKCASTGPMSMDHHLWEYYFECDHIRAESKTCNVTVCAKNHGDSVELHRLLKEECQMLCNRCHRVKTKADVVEWQRPESARLLEEIRCLEELAGVTTEPDGTFISFVPRIRTAEEDAWFMLKNTEWKKRTIRLGEAVRGERRGTTLGKVGAEGGGGGGGGDHDGEGKGEAKDDDTSNDDENHDGEADNDDDSGDDDESPDSEAEKDDDSSDDDKNHDDSVDRGAGTGAGAGASLCSAAVVHHGKGGGTSKPASVQSPLGAFLKR
jgi:5-methylcytosine-specific restriction endonuclease McrA